MIAPQAATCFRQWVILPEKCSGADAIMQAEMNRDIISAPCLSRKIKGDSRIFKRTEYSCKHLIFRQRSRIICVNSHDFSGEFLGFDHGVGHPLLLLYNAKAPNCRKNKAFNGLDHYSEWPKVADAVIKASFCHIKCRD